MNITVEQTIKQFGFKLVAGETETERQITGVYICDLLSWVMGNAQENSAWVTIQGHINIVAVALLTGVSCIIVAEDGEISDSTIEKANAENIPILTTNLTAYEIAEKFALL